MFGWVCVYIYMYVIICRKINALIRSYGYLPSYISKCACGSASRLRSGPWSPHPRGLGVNSFCDHNINPKTPFRYISAAVRLTSMSTLPGFWSITSQPYPRTGAAQNVQTLTGTPSYSKKNMGFCKFVMWRWVVRTASTTFTLLRGKEVRPLAGTAAQRNPRIQLTGVAIAIACHSHLKSFEYWNERDYLQSSNIILML